MLVRLGSLILAVLVLASSPLSAQLTGVGIRLVPRADEAALSYFEYNLAGGQSGQDSLEIRNNGESPLKMLVYPGDAWTTPDGGLGGPLLGESSKSTGLWVKSEISEVEIQGRETKEIPFRISVPEGTPAGDYMALLFVQEAGKADEAPEAQGADEKKAAFAVTLQTRFAIVLWVRVPGALNPGLALEPPVKAVQDGRLTLSYNLRNDGNVFLKPSTSWVLLAPDGTEVASAPRLEGASLVPGGTMAIPVQLPTDQALVRGSYRLQVKAGAEPKGAAAISASQDFEVPLP